MCRRRQAKSDSRQEIEGRQRAWDSATGRRVQVINNHSTWASLLSQAKLVNLTALHDQNLARPSHGRFPHYTGSSSKPPVRGHPSQQKAR